MLRGAAKTEQQQQVPPQPRRSTRGAAHATVLRGHSFLSSINQELLHEGSLSASNREGTPSAVEPPLSLAQTPRSDDSTDLTREPTMLHNSDALLPSPAAEHRYTVVLDLDETVVYGRSGPLTARAHLRSLLRTLSDVAEVVVWTAGEKSYAKAVVREINKEGIIKHLVYRDDTWFNETSYTKDLRQLGRDLDYVLIVENTPDCVRANPSNGIIVSDFEGCTTRRDETLLKLAEVVRALVKSGRPVAEFLPTCRLLRRQVVVSAEGVEIPIFFLSGRARRRRTTTTTSDHADDDGDEVDTECKQVKPNRDRQSPPLQPKPH